MEKGGLARGGMDKRTVILGATLSLAFIAILAPFLGFAIDDAFIIYRYSEHLANGHGIVWNVGYGPEEGYTSFLWVLLNAGAVKFGASPVIFSKVFSLACSLAILWILAYRARTLSLGAGIILSGAIAFSPAFALLTAQGLETSLAALLLTLLGGAAISSAGKPNSRGPAFFFALFFLAFLARPDAAVFASGAAVTMGAIFLAKKDYSSLGKMTLAGGGALLLFLGYMGWRYFYFGHLLPNPYLVKIEAGQGLIKPRALASVISFVFAVLLPYLIYFVYSAARNWDRARFISVLPVLVGFVLHLLYLLTVLPIQAYLWRYVFPAYPAFLLATGYYLSGARPGKISERRWLSRALCAMVLIYCLATFPLAFEYKENKNSHDRIEAGKALSGLAGVMFVSESGAVPYYSGWRAIDLIGLNYRPIAEKGLDPVILEAIDPDLVLIHEPSGKYSPHLKNKIVVNEYMISNGFAAVAAVKKTEGEYHFYFARQDSPLFKKIAVRLNSIESVEYGDLGKLVWEKRMPIIDGRYRAAPGGGH